MLITLLIMSILHKFGRGLKFSRRSLFLVGLGLIFVLYFAQRISTYIRSDFTQGTLVCDDLNELKQYEADMTLYYYVGAKEYSVPVFTQTELAYQPLKVRYLKNHPERGHIYTVGSYWFLSMLWLLAPIMLWGALVFASFVDDKGELGIRFARRKMGEENEAGAEEAENEPRVPNEIAEKQK